MLAQDIGEGVLDNIIISSAVHRSWGAFTVFVLFVTLVLLTKDVAQSNPASRLTRWSFVVAQVALVVQALLGIKLLDQGQGIRQLYIHYVGGLIPLGVFLVGGWVARGDSKRSARILLVLLAVGFGSALMAFVIGQAYVNR